jgi:4-amino-4-deoxy-L-arabinose transferase-like glycosyltransferase
MFQQLKELYEFHRKGDPYSLLPLMFLAIVVYLQQAWVPGFFHDGYLYAAFGKHASELGHWLIPHLNQSTYAEFPDHSPFLFIVEGLFFKVFGSGVIQARLFAAFFSIGAVCGLYLFLQKNTDRKRAFYSTLLFISIYPLIKKTRFPNMDVAIMLTMMIALFSYYKEKWFACGLFSGVTMLIKGPIAFLIPLSILVHIIVTKGWTKLKHTSPWISFLLAFLIFSLWPFLLLINGRFDIFEKYIHSTFFHTISGGRGLVDYQFHAYLVFLLKQTPHLFILVLLATIRKKDELTKFSLTVFYTIFIFLTVQKLKYSHYLIPLYPFYALAAGEFVSKIAKKWDEKLTFSIKILGPILALVLLIFPLTTKIKRDKELFKTKEVVGGLNVKPNAWAIIGESYPFFAATNFFAYYDHAEVYRGKSSLIKAWLEGSDLNQHVIMDFPQEMNNFLWGFLVRSQDVEQWRIHYPLFDQKLVSILQFKKKGLTVLLPKIYFGEDALLKLP